MKVGSENGCELGLRWFFPKMRGPEEDGCPIKHVGHDGDEDGCPMTTVGHDGGVENREANKEKMATRWNLSDMTEG